MFKKLITVLSCIAMQFSAVSLFSETVSGETQNSDTGTGFSFEVSEGYRQDKLQWSISGHHKKPNILSELTFHDIKIYQTRLATKLTMDDYFAKANFGYGDITSGRVRDSDYSKNNKKGEFSRSRSKIRGSHTLDAQVSFGKDIAVHPSITLSPLFGYMWDYEKLRFKDGRQQRLFGFKMNEKIRKLNSTYTSRWDAPFIGARFGFDATEKLSFFGEYDFLFAVRHHGTGHWNLRNRGKGMTFNLNSRRAKGWGQMGLIGAGYEVFNNFIVKAEYQISNLRAHGGKVTGSERHHKFRQPFHKAELTSSEVRLCLDYAF